MKEAGVPAISAEKAGTNVRRLDARTSTYPSLVDNRASGPQQHVKDWKSKDRKTATAYQSKKTPNN